MFKNVITDGLAVYRVVTDKRVGGDKRCYVSSKSWIIEARQIQGLIPLETYNLVSP